MENEVVQDPSVLPKAHTHVGNPSGPVPLHDFLHLIQGGVTIAAELESQVPVGGQCWQPHEL